MKSFKNRKATFVLPAQVLDEMHELVSIGLANSVSSLVREAIESKVRELREELLKKEFEEAARDPYFMKDIDQTMNLFHSADGETARMIPK